MKKRKLSKFKKIVSAFAISQLLLLNMIYLESDSNISKASEVSLTNIQAEKTVEVPKTENMHISYNLNPGKEQNAGYIVSIDSSNHSHSTNIGIGVGLYYGNGYENVSLEPVAPIVTSSLLEEISSIVPETEIVIELEEVSSSVPERETVTSTEETSSSAPETETVTSTEETSSNAPETETVTSTEETSSNAPETETVTSTEETSSNA
ncbi:hypothetical protein IR073_06650, partial [Gemella sp. 19428wG2_WT2a]